MKLTKSQERHLAVLTGEWVSMKDMRKTYGFCKLNTLYKLLRLGLTEHKSFDGVLENTMVRLKG